MFSYLDIFFILPSAIQGNFNSFITIYVNIYFYLSIYKSEVILTIVALVSSINRFKNVIYMNEYYSAFIKKPSIWTTRMNPKGTMLSEISQHRKENTVLIISIICGNY